MSICKVEWSLAYRVHNGKYLFDDPSLLSEFKVVKNSRRYWCADPFLIDYHGEDYVFFEMYDRLKRKGCIGYRKFNSDGSMTPMKKVFEEEGHLSYPNILVHDNTIYMVPESSASNQLYVLRAEAFPNVWRKEKVLLDGIKLVDTTFITIADKHYLFTTPITKDNVSLLSVCRIGNDGVIDEQALSVHRICDKSVARMGGNFLSLDDRTVRVSQDCSRSYGGGIIFSNIDELSDESYAESEFCRISGAITIQGKVFNGIHTYNHNSKYEFIDLKTAQKFSVVEIIGYVLQRLKKISSKK